MNTIERPTARASASLDYGFGRAAGRDRIGVSIYDSPAVVLVANHTGDSQGNRRELVAAAELGPVSLDLDEAGEVHSCIRCNSFKAHDLAVSIKRCGPGDGLRDLFPSAHERAEWVADGDVVPMGEQLQSGLRITLDEFAPRQVRPLDHVFRAVHNDIFSLISLSDNQREARRIADELERLDEAAAG
ncbi:MAG: hypothetical protein QOH28_1464 [Actinomycetota bacterium]|nr:hypothetical protein [Actinomycetota bacterium]